MSSNLSDIQLQIVLSVQGAGVPSSVVRNLQGISKAANGVVSSANQVSVVNRSQIRSWDDLTKQLGDVERKYDAVFRAGVHMTQMGSSLMGLSQQISGTLGKAVDAWGNFEFTLNRAAAAAGIFTKTDLFKNGANKYDALKTAVYGAAKEMRVFPAQDIAKATYFWESTTGQAINTQQELATTMKGVTAIMKAAAMTDTDYETAIKGVYSILQQYHLPVSKAADVTSELYLMTQKTALEFPDLVNSFKMVGPIAAANSIKFEDMAQVLGRIGDAGIRGTMAGRAMRQFFIQIVKPSGPAQKALDKVYDATFKVKNAWQKMTFPKGKFVGLEQHLKNLTLVTKNMTEAERNHFLAQITTANELPVLTALIDQQRRGWDKSKYSLTNATSAFNKSFNLLRTSWKGMVGLLKETVEPIILEVGRHIAEALTPFLNKAADIAQKVQDWVKANPKIVDMGVKFAALAAAGLAAAGALFIVGGSILFIIGNIGNFVQGIGKVMTPFALLAVVIGAFIAIVVKNVGGLRDAFSNLFNAIGGLVKAIIGDGSQLKSAWSSLWDALRPIAESAAHALAVAINFLADRIRDLSKNKTFIEWARRIISIFLTFRGAIGIIGAVSAGMWALGKASNFAFGAFKAVSGLNTLIPVFKGLWTVIMMLKDGTLLLRIQLFLLAAQEKIVGFFTALSSIFRASAISAALLDVALSPITIAILALGAVVVGFLAYQNNWFGFRDIVNNVVGAITGFIGGFINWVTGTALPTIGRFVSGVIGFFTSLPANIAGAWNSILAGIGSFVSNAWAAITGWIGNVIGAIGSFVAQIPAAILGMLQNLADNWSYYLGYIIGFILGFTARVLIEIGKFIITAGANFLSWLSSLPGAFADWFGRVWNGLVAWFTKTITNIGTWMSTVFNNVVHWLSQLPGNVANWLSRVATEFVNWIGSLPGKVWNWFSSLYTNVSTWFATLIPKVATWAGQVAGNIINYFKSLPGKVMDAVSALPGDLLIFLLHLPEFLWDSIVGIGKAIITGIWNGVVSMWNWLVDHITGFFKGIIDGIKDGLGIHSPSKVMAKIGTQMIQGMAVGIQTTNDAHDALRQYTNSLVGAAQDAGSQITSAIGGVSTSANMSFTSSGERVLRVELDITSSDGSVDQYSLDQLKSALTGSDLVSALEAMGTK